MNETTDDSFAVPKHNFKKRYFFILIILVTALVCNYTFSLTKAPSGWNESVILEIEPGMSVTKIAQTAEQIGIVRSNLLLYAVMTYFYDPTNIHAGTYIFQEPISVFEVAKKIASSDVSDSLFTITLPEGVRLTKMAEIASRQLKSFDVETYLANTAELEGYLFPETYFVPKDFTADDMIELQRATYEENIEPLRSLIASSTFTEYEVLTLASIIEREANDEESMKMVSGILQNRLSIGMALQADATMEYVLDTPLNELPEGQLASELRETESPYNTYLNPGLTPTPIGNPGLQSIKAVLMPTKSDNFYYITDEEGVFHYAKTFDEHKRNVQKYLR